MSKIDDAGAGSVAGSKPGSLGKDVLGPMSGDMNGKTSAVEKRADSTEQALEKMSGVTLESSPFGQKTRPESQSKLGGPSLLSQQAPATPIQLTASTSSNPAPQSPAVAQGRQQTLNIAHEGMEGIGQLLEAGSVQIADAAEKITVKIADLGNGTFSCCPSLYRTDLCR